MPDQLETLPAGTGTAIKLDEGARLRLVNTHGSQVVDFWAFNAADSRECLSMHHTRGRDYRLTPRSGDTLVTLRRRPILAFEEDTSPGIHDTLIPCCDAVRYRELGMGEHANCADNLIQALQPHGIGLAVIPAPFNLFMNVAPGPDGALVRAAPESRPGDYVVFRALMPCLVALSACPADMWNVNGTDNTPRDVHYQVMTA